MRCRSARRRRRKSGGRGGGGGGGGREPRRRHSPSGAGSGRSPPRCLRAQHDPGHPQPEPEPEREPEPQPELGMLGGHRAARDAGLAPSGEGGPAPPPPPPSSAAPGGSAPTPPCAAPRGAATPRGAGERCAPSAQPRTPRGSRCSRTPDPHFGGDRNSLSIPEAGDRGDAAPFPPSQYPGSCIAALENVPRVSQQRWDGAQRGPCIPPGFGDSQDIPARPWHGASRGILRCQPGVEPSGVGAGSAPRERGWGQDSPKQPSTARLGLARPCSGSWWLPELGTAVLALQVVALQRWHRAPIHGTALIVPVTAARLW